MALCTETPRQAEMVELLKCQLNEPERLEFTPNPLPCLRNLQWVKDMKLAKEFREFAKFLPWEFSPRAADKGEEMAVCNFSQMFNLGKVVCGLMYVDSEKVYPEHNHRPDETYFLISGTGEWRWGGNHDYRSITAGNVIYNHPWNWHGIRADSTPVLAMYVLCPDSPGQLPSAIQKHD